MHNDYTHLVNGKRQWTTLGLEHLNDAGKIENHFVRFNALKCILTQSFKECGGTYSSKHEKDNSCTWTISTQDWVWYVILYTAIQNGKKVILLKIGDSKSRPERDLFPLWSILRENWQSENQDTRQ